MLRSSLHAIKSRYSVGPVAHDNDAEGSSNSSSNVSSGSASGASGSSTRTSESSNGSGNKAGGHRTFIATSNELKFARGGGFGVPPKKAFKIPLRPADVSLNGRKRKRVDYASMGGGDDNGRDGDAQFDDDSDGENTAPNGKKSKKSKNSNEKPVTLEGYKNVGSKGESLIKLRRFEKIDITDPMRIKGQFRLPKMKDKNGKELPVALSHRVLGVRAQLDIPPRPLHDPQGESAIVLFDPTVDDKEAQRKKDELQKQQAEAEAKLSQQENAQDALQLPQPPCNVHKSLAQMLGIRTKEMNKIQEKVPVVIDPMLTKILRPHQVEGVRFLYRCATGLVQENAFGSIMADGMGLGKTLQCIALMWTLLKQSPIPRKSTIEKCIIVCPATLVRNWANEMTKWLGLYAPGLFIIDGTLSRDQLNEEVLKWCSQRGREVSRPVMIVSYETLRNVTEVMGPAEVGLLLCDEGHRLKNGENRLYEALTAINVKRRVILSGTPIQNDLIEYYSLLSFANPALLGDRASFKKNYENAILRGRDAGASDKEREKGDAKLKELLELVGHFIIRRSNELNTKYLPVKYEHLVFCELSDFQKKLYRLFLEPDGAKRKKKTSDKRKDRKNKAAADAAEEAEDEDEEELLRLNELIRRQPLKAIDTLKKICNHPDLIENIAEVLEGSEKLFPPGYDPGSMRNRSVNCSLSGKFQVLDRFLRKMRQRSNDKIVLISNYTQTLNLFERMCRQNSWGYFKLDGTMTVNKRQKFVDQFNDPERPEFIFLLSSKAGGCGINLIGANRLVLFDPDWNPAADQQALARVWREGQKKDCYVYRFLSTGSLEEKILQRQFSKQALSKVVVDTDAENSRRFSSKELRELFTLNEETICDTHHTIQCERCSNGRQHTKPGVMLNEDASTWNHYSREDFGKIHDDLLREELGHEIVSFVFQFCSV